MSIRILIKDSPHRAIALTTSTHALVLRYSSSSVEKNSNFNASTTSLGSIGADAARCMVEFSKLLEVDLNDYRPLHSVNTHGTLGLITINDDIFLIVVNGSSRVATARPGETVQRIHSVGFYCLTSSSYDALLNDDVNPYPTDTIDDEGFEMGFGGKKEQPPVEHPCLALKKLLSSGTFYYSSDFDLTRRLQDRITDATTVSIDSLNAGFLWNSYMIQPLVDFRNRLAPREKEALDASGILTSAIRGFALTVTVPTSSAPIKTQGSGMPSSMTLISRLSCRRAGTRFNARGIDDDGNVANFVETETIYWTPTGACFSYVQVRGSVPVFWEQQTGLLPGQQKITITRSPAATQPAFDKHFEYLELGYGAIHVVNLLSNEKQSEVELSDRYRYHIQQSPLNQGNERGNRDHRLVRLTEYDFHAETRGPGGYEMASSIAEWIRESAEGFSYFLSQDVQQDALINGQHHIMRRSMIISQQEGVFRTNCLDCLDRTNLVQTIISKTAIDIYLRHKSTRASNDFWVRHSSMWADNGDALSRIYAGTGALKSSFTRHGKMSLAGALADARKSATRMYINNFADKGRQNTIDMLLGRLMGQAPVHLYDPINDHVMTELVRRSAEFSKTAMISMLVGTFNLNGKTDGITEDLSPWLCPAVDLSQQCPEMVAVGFQEIVDLSPQQIMSVDSARRDMWEDAVRRTLNRNAKKYGRDEYVILRGGQLVGASLSVFVRSDCLKDIKNVEGSLKKTGMSGMAGNKGAVAIRFEYANTSICLVTAHLAAGFANYEERNRDYKTISHGLRFQRNRSIEDHDTVIWLGDFNYRIGLANEKVQRLCSANDLETLYENDQLNLQMVAGLAFPHYSEARITFQPTYKYDLNSDQFDTSEKARIPAWCDRVLCKGDNIRQVHYDSAPLRFSDHRPVYATFLVTIQKIDEKKKEALKETLYRQRKEYIGHGRVEGHLDEEESDDEDLIGYESVEPGLPPASSDRRKWWLDNGLPAKARIQPPADNHLPNPKRPSNPFTPSPEPDWIDVETLSNNGKPESLAARGTQRTAASDFGGASRPTSVPNSITSVQYGFSSLNQSLSTRGTIVPQHVGQSPQPGEDIVQDPLYALKRSTASITTPASPALSDRPTQPMMEATHALKFPTDASRKSVPPLVPSKKLSLLSKAPSPTSNSVFSSSSPVPTRQTLPDDASGQRQRRPEPPPPRRSMAVLSSDVRRPIQGLVQGGDKPPLPPRTTSKEEGDRPVKGSKSLMDEEPEELSSLKDWEVLKPVQ